MITSHAEVLRQMRADSLKLCHILIDDRWQLIGSWGGPIIGRESVVSGEAAHAAIETAELYDPREGKRGPFENPLYRLPGEDA